MFRCLACLSRISWAASSSDPVNTLLILCFPWCVKICLSLLVLRNNLAILIPTTISLPKSDVSLLQAKVFSVISKVIFQGLSLTSIKCTMAFMKSPALSAIKQSSRVILPLEMSKCIFAMSTSPMTNFRVVVKNQTIWRNFMRSDKIIPSEK